MFLFFFLMIRRPPRSTLDRSSAASDVYKRQDYVFMQSKDGQLKSFYKTIDDDFLEAEHLEELFDLQFLSPQFKKMLLSEIYTETCLLYTSPSPRDRTRSRMPSSA